MILGQAHPAIVKAVSEQVARGTHLSASTELEVKWGTLVKQLVPSAERLRFVSSGTEAMMMTFRMARSHSGKTKIIKFENAFHGWADGAVRGRGERPPRRRRHSKPGARDDDSAALRHSGGGARSGRGRRRGGSGVPGQPGHPPVVPRATAGTHAAEGRHSHIRRGGERLPLLARRLPGAVRRDTGLDGHGQDTGRRAARRLRGRPRRHREHRLAPAASRIPAPSTPTRCPPRRARPRWNSSPTSR